MAKKFYTSEQAMRELGIGKARLSQLVNGYTTTRVATNGKSVVIPPAVEEGVDYIYERRTVEGPKRAITRHVMLFTKAGVEKLRAAKGERGRPRKSES